MQQQTANNPLGQSQTRRSLIYSTADGSCYGAMMGIGEANIVPLAQHLFRSEVVAGLAGPVPMVLGTVIALVSPSAVSRLGSHRRWIFISAMAQACTFIPLIIAALVGSINVWLFFAVVTLYWAGAQSAGLTWNTFIAGLVHPRIRARYFSQRTRINNYALIVATLLSAAILGATQAGPDGPPAIQIGAAFALVMAIAAAARYASAFLLYGQHEAVPIPAGHRHLSISEFVHVWRTTSAGRLITYILVAQLTIQVSTPFVHPYLLSRVGLEHDYLLFGVMLAVQLTAKALSLPLFGRLAQSLGPRAVLKIGAILIVPQPALWLLPPTTPVLVILQICSGVATVAFELGVFLMLLRHVDDGLRTSVMTRYQLLSTICSVVGAVSGAVILYEFGGSARGFSILFTVGLFLRLLTLPLFVRIPVDASDLLPAGRVAVDVHPAHGVSDAPVVVSASDRPRA